MQKLRTFILSIVICMSCSMTYAQTRVTGHVADVNGESIIGATILEKGTTNGTVSDMNGNFTLNVSQGATLQISYVGYVTQEIAATNQPLRIVLVEDMQALEEVVVVGYGTMRRRTLPGQLYRSTRRK